MNSSKTSTKTKKAEPKIEAEPLAAFNAAIERKEASEISAELNKLYRSRVSVTPEMRVNALSAALQDKTKKGKDVILQEKLFLIKGDPETGAYQVFVKEMLLDESRDALKRFCAILIDLLSESPKATLLEFFSTFVTETMERSKEPQFLNDKVTHERCRGKTLFWWLGVAATNGYPKALEMLSDQLSAETLAELLTFNLENDPSPSPLKEQTVSYEFAVAASRGYPRSLEILCEKLSSSDTEKFLNLLTLNTQTGKGRTPLWLIAKTAAKQRPQIKTVKPKFLCFFFLA